MPTTAIEGLVECGGQNADCGITMDCSISGKRANVEASIQPAIDITTMTYPSDGHDQPWIVNRIESSIVADTNAVEIILALQLDCSRRPGIVREGQDACVHLSKDSLVQRLQVAGGR
jgi:hypothetical protein